MSYVRAYKEHVCTFIFVFNQLAFAEVAVGFGLIFFPKMPDLKHFNIKFRGPAGQFWGRYLAYCLRSSSFVPLLTGLKPADVKYKDAKREKQRVTNQEALGEKRKKEQQEREAKQKEYQKKKEKAGPKRRVKRQHKGWEIPFVFGFVFVCFCFCFCFRNVCLFIFKLIDRRNGRRMG